MHKKKNKKTINQNLYKYMPYTHPLQELAQQHRWSCSQEAQLNIPGMQLWSRMNHQIAFETFIIDGIWIVNMSFCLKFNALSIGDSLHSVNLILKKFILLRGNLHYIGGKS